MVGCSSHFNGMRYCKLCSFDTSLRSITRWVCQSHLHICDVFHVTLLRQNGEILDPWVLVDTYNPRGTASTGCRARSGAKPPKPHQNPVESQASHSTPPSDHGGSQDIPPIFD